MFRPSRCWTTLRWACRRASGRIGLACVASSLTSAAALDSLLQPDEPVSNLTVGERQQLELVRLLGSGRPCRSSSTSRPRASQRRRKKLLFDTLHRLADEGLTVIFVSHKLDDVEALCSAATVLRCRSGRWLAARAVRQGRPGRAHVRSRDGSASLCVRMHRASAGCGCRG